MKKTLFTLSILAFTAISTAQAAYYYNNNSSYDTSYYTTTSYSYPGYVDYGNHYSYGSRASYTVNCITYYYDPRTGASLGQEQICTTPVYPTPTYPSYPTYPTYPTYDYGYNYGYTYTQPSQYTTYGYSNGSWYPGYSSGGIFGSFTNAGYNNSSCYYQNGYQVCY